MWAQIASTLRQSLVELVIWAHQQGPTLAFAGFVAWVFGMKLGHQGRAMRVTVAGGVIITYAGLPVALNYLGLAPDIWKGMVTVFLAVVSWRVLQWAEVMLLKRLGITKEEMLKEDLSNRDKP